ncbi:MAG: hypothetical protein LAO30_13310 [Acidobacteriia bacterium]|nr:hypothetical protein [Terriglobia bacterium]
MTQLASWLSSNTAAFSIMGAAVAFIVSTIQQIFQRRADAREREFQAFHKLVRDLVAPHQPGGAQGMPAQAAIIFELRHFDRYREFTRRLLEMLKKEWGTDTGSPELVLEMELTLKHIQ